MKKEPYEILKDGNESKRFVDLTKRLVAVPKKDVDKQLEKERKERAERKKRKA